MSAIADMPPRGAGSTQSGPLVIHTLPVLPMDEDQLFRFCRINDDLRIERDASGDLIIMSPEGLGSGAGNAELAAVFAVWSKRDGSGRIFGSSTGFILPNGAMRAPDLSWVRHERLKRLGKEERERFPRLCPDFVLELLSPSDSRRRVQVKMEEYIANGAQLAWMIDPQRKQVHTYKPGHEPEILDNPQFVSGEPVLKGFSLSLADLWSAINFED